MRPTEDEEDEEGDGDGEGERDEEEGEGFSVDFGIFRKHFIYKREICVICNGLIIGICYFGWKGHSKMSSSSSSLSSSSSFSSFIPFTLYHISLASPHANAISFLSSSSSIPPPFSSSFYSIPSLSPVSSHTSASPSPLILYAHVISYESLWRKGCEWKEILESLLPTSESEKQKEFSSSSCATSASHSLETNKPETSQKDFSFYRGK